MLAGEVDADLSCSQIVTKPCMPTVATKANASVTPPNWASTPHDAVTIRRSSAARTAGGDGVRQEGAEHGSEHGRDGRQDDRVDEGRDDLRLDQGGDVAQAGAGCCRPGTPR